MVSPIEIVGCALSSGDALLKSYSALENLADAKRELPLLLEESEERVGRICESIKVYTKGVDKHAIPGKVLKRAADEFEEIKKENERLIKKHERKIIIWKWVQLSRHTGKFRDNNAKLIALEHNLDVCGLISQETISLRKQMDKVLRILNSRGDSELSAVVGTVDTMNRDDVDVIPVQAKCLLDALAKSGLSTGTKRELATMARNVWEGWKINRDDVEFVRHSDGDRQRIGQGGTSQVYLAIMNKRDKSDRIILEHMKEVAVKTFSVIPSEATAEFPRFIREVFLQKDAQHPCIVRTLGGYWPEPEECENRREIEPFIVMERMTHSLKDMLESQLLVSFATKRRILLDIAAGIGHLHSRGIVHCDIKPENVLLHLVDNQIAGRAKVTDFGLSRKARNTDVMTTNVTSAGVPATFHYLPPEYFTTSAPKASKLSRDIWSFGVLMCEVLEPGFLRNVSRDIPEGVPVAAVGGKFAKNVAENAQNITGEQALKDLVKSCLSSDPNLRPSIDDVSSQLAKPTYEFHFVNYLSQQFKEKEVFRYLRHYFSSEFQGQSCTAERATAILQNAVQAGNLSAQNVLAYCKYYGIGVAKDEKAAAELYQLGSDAGDVTAKYSLGAVRFLENKYESAVPLLTEAANLGNAGAMMWLAICFQNGYGVEKDVKKAFVLTSSAANEGSQDAYTYLASYYMFGIGTEKNESKAVAMLYGLSANGNAYAAMWLSLVFDQGLGVAKDTQKAKECLELARERGISAIWASDEDRNNWVLQ